MRQPLKKQATVVAKVKDGKKDKENEVQEMTDETFTENSSDKLDKE